MKDISLENYYYNITTIKDTPDYLIQRSNLRHLARMSISYYLYRKYMRKYKYKEDKYTAVGEIYNLPYFVSKYLTYYAIYYDCFIYHERRFLPDKVELDIARLHKVLGIRDLPLKEISLDKRKSLALSPLLKFANDLVKDYCMIYYKEKFCNYYHTYYRNLYSLRRKNG